MPVSYEPPLRVALFTDTFFEANGVGTLSRNLAQFARDNHLPLLVVRGGQQTGLHSDGSVEFLELKRGPASFRVDKGLYCDPFLARHKQLIIDQLSRFKPDLVHITGPGDLGFLGVWLSHMLRIPMAASWHTNLHEYLSRRLERVLRVLPRKMRGRAASALESQSLRALLRFYRMPRFVLAPNQTLVDLLHNRTGRPAFLMMHGVDLTSFHPMAPTKNGNHPFCIGYVGRLTTEKNVRYFVDLERKLIASGESNFRFLLVGDGGQQNWLRRRMRHADLPGVLRGPELTQAYRQMDAFVFPSRTDTFGLVVLEAMASGVPAVLPPEVGKRIGVEDGVSGFLSNDFLESVQRLMHDRELRLAMAEGARRCADAHSWQTVFEKLYCTYREGLAIEDRRRVDKEAHLQRR